MSVFTRPAGALVLSGAQQSNPADNAPAIALIALLIVVAVYAAIVVAEIALVSRARKQRAQWRENKQRALDELVNARSRLTELSATVGSGLHGEPYKSLHDSGRQLIERGLADIDRLLQRIEQNALRDIPDQPMLRALLLIPLAVEIARHRRQQREMEAIRSEVGPAAGVVAQVEALKDEIASLGQREKALAAQLRQKALELTAGVQAETRPALPLEDERRMLARAGQSLDTIEHLLRAEQPDETEVVAAFPMRAYVENDLAAVDASLKQIAAAREQTEEQLREAGNRLAALQADIEQDVAAGCRRDRLAEQAGALAGQLDSLKIAFDEGRYAQVSGDAPGLLAALNAAQETIQRVRAARERIAAARDGAALRLDDLRAAIRETPARFERDITRKLAQQIEEAVASLEALLPSEDLDAMAGAQTIEQQIDTWLKQAAQAQHAFDANRRALEQQAEALNDNTINATVAAADKAAGILRACHPHYWIGPTPDDAQAAGADLKRAWDALAAEMETIAESAFSAILSRVAQIRQQQDALAALVADTEQIGTRARNDEQRARSLLDDPALARQMEAFQQAAPHSDELAARVDEFSAAYQQLRQLAQEAIPYWADILARVTRLREELTAALNAYQQQLAQARDELTRLTARLEQMRGALESLTGQPTLDFESPAQAPLQAIREWLTARAGVNEGSLRDIQAAIAGGEAIRAAAQDRIAVMRQQQSAFASGQAAIEGILSEANALIQQAGRLQQDGSPYGAAVWAPRALAPARRALAGVTERLTQLLQSESKQDAETALAELGRIRSDAEAVIAPLTQTVNALEANVTELRGLREELKQLEAQARELSAREAGRAEQWAATQERIADLEDRWTHATSFEEARDALKAAQELARESITALLMEATSAPGDTSRG